MNYNDRFGWHFFYTYPCLRATAAKSSAYLELRRDQILRCPPGQSLRSEGSTPCSRQRSGDCPLSWERGLEPRLSTLVAKSIFSLIQNYPFVTDYQTWKKTNILKKFNLVSLIRTLKKQHKGWNKK